MPVKERYQKNKQHYLDYQLNWAKDFRKNKKELNLLQQAKTRANRAGLEFNLELEDIIIPEKCPILDIPIFSGQGKVCVNSPTLDRINNLKGYIKGNVAVISAKANKNKCDMTPAEIERLYHYVHG